MNPYEAPKAIVKPRGHIDGVIALSLPGLPPNAIRVIAIAVLIAEACHLVLSGWFDGLLPQQLLEIKGAQRHVQVTLQTVALGLFGLAIVICMFVGLLGLAFLKSWGRLLYTVFWIGDILLMPFLHPQIRAPLEIAFSEAKLLAAGALLALVWLPAAQRQPASTSRAAPNLAFNRTPGHARLFLPSAGGRAPVNLIVRSHEKPGSPAAGGHLERRANPGERNANTAVSVAKCND